MLRVQHPSGSGVNGDQYPADKNGVVTVPDELAHRLVELHGFEYATVDEDEEERAAREQKEAEEEAAEEEVEAETPRTKRTKVKAE